MNKLKTVSLGLLMVTSSAAFAEGEGSVVHFNGHVNEPTCAIVPANQNITLETVGASAFENVAIGDSIENGSRDFEIHVNCEDKNLGNHIKLVMKASADETQPKVLKNASNNTSGVGLEVFYNNEILTPNQELDGSRINNLNKGDDNINMKVRYARLSNNITGGDVSADVTFVTEYR
ncbi:hypothetical protein B1H58_14795 [Pantoea alhagi]|uniref:Fimbrial-type adhesion domain-containing protein n=1 Tax=Pantoea alhagi TaxID=1891675 RepID=A0A1W6B7W3_9GAMM|nr:fimbrial protein [Pantoea alhagi]ARJ43171.1 hypothetical protein B1H58_14795 [Pantoea alhagi]